MQQAAGSLQLFCAYSTSDIYIYVSIMVGTCFCLEHIHLTTTLIENSTVSTYIDITYQHSHHFVLEALSVLECASRLSLDQRNLSRLEK